MWACCVVLWTSRRGCLLIMLICLFQARDSGSQPVLHLQAAPPSHDPEDGQMPAEQILTTHELHRTQQLCGHHGKAHS